jgi:hypothetical protein
MFTYSSALIKYLLSCVFSDEPTPSSSGDCQSEDSRNRAAIMTMDKKCREDVFYIGSRAVCQLVVFHGGMGPEEQRKTGLGDGGEGVVGGEEGQKGEEEMQTE